MGKYFGTDGFRGEANVDLTVMHAFEIGRYLGWYYGKEHKCKIVIGKDTRRSSYMFEYALVAGLVTASDSYIEGEDAALLINEEVAAPQVYTLAGNQMTAINVTPELKDIPVGIYGKDASPVELSFKLSGDMQNVTLVDKQSGKVYPVTDGLTLTVSGNTSGRYFLNGSIATSNEVIARNEIVCYANGNGQIVVSSVDPLTRISVYSVSGQRLRYLDNLNMQTVYVKDLAPGIYIVKAESVTQVCSEKMEVK